MNQVVNETTAKLDENRYAIEDGLGIVFSDETWLLLQKVILRYIDGKSAWGNRTLTAKERDAILEVAEASLRLSEALRSIPTDLHLRLLLSFRKNTLPSILEVKSMVEGNGGPSLLDATNWAAACLNLLSSNPTQKKGQKRSVEETNFFLAKMKICFDSAVPQDRNSKPASFNKFVTEIFALLPAHYPNRPHSVSAALKAFQRYNSGQT